MKIKVVAISLAVLVLMSSLAACGPAKEEKTEPSPTSSSSSEASESASLKPESGAELLVWDTQGNELDYLKKVGEDFEQKYGVPVKVAPVPNIDTVGKLVTDGPAGIGADVFSAPHDHVGKAVTAGLVLENDRTRDDIEKNDVPAALPALSYEDKLYGYPIAMDTYALYYNKKLLKEAPKTYEELIAFAKTYNDPKSKKFAFVWDVGQVYLAYSFLSGYGGYLFGNQGTDPGDIGLNNAGAVEGAKFMQSLKEILPLNAEDVNNTVVTGLFQEGKAAAMLYGPGQMESLSKTDIDFGVAPLPMLPGGKQPRSLLSIRGLFVNSYTKYPVAAKMFAEFASSPDNLKTRFEMTGQLPPRKDFVSDKNGVQAFLQQAIYADPLPSIPETGTLWVPSFAALSSIWSKGEDPQKALNRMVEQMKTAMKTNNQ